MLSGAEVMRDKLVSPEPDDANKRAIDGFFWLRGAERRRLLSTPDPSLREQVVGRVKRRLVLGLLLAFGLALTVLARLEIPGNLLLGSGVAQLDAGRIEAIEMHSTLLSDKTTVRTTLGTFQVHGSVSALLGDPVYLQRDGERGRMRLCLDSQIRRQCYWVL